MGNDQFHHKEKEKEARIAKEKRVRGNREPKKKILILCDAEKTEPLYFEGFRTALRWSNVIITIPRNCFGKDLSKLIKTAKENVKNYDQIWCVFDRDDVPAENFKLPFQLSEKQKKKIKIAYSNEAFELWYLLHFNYYNTGISRQQYIDKLSTLLGYKYLKDSKEMYAKLLDKQQTAIANAENLLATYSNLNPEQDNPSTTVHLLVEELNKYKRK